MTTIAFDGKTIVSDRQGTHDYIEGGFRKIRRINGAIYGACGSAEQVEQFFEWVKNGGEKPDLDGFVGMEVKGKKCNWFGDRLMRIKTPAPIAIGSGSRFAMGAMLAGADARQAVKIASKLDIYTGRGVKSYETTDRKRNKA